MAAQRYASVADVGTVGLSGSASKMLDAGAALTAGTLAFPLGPVASVAAGAGAVGLSEKAQAMLLKRTYEGAAKSTPKMIEKTAAKSTEVPKVLPPTNPSIGDKPTPKTTRASKPLSSGFVKIGNAKPPQEALNTMSDFTDYVSGSYKLKGEAASSMEQEAADLYDKYIGGRPPKTLQGLANAFGKTLEKNNYLKEQGRDSAGRFSGK